MPALHRVQRHLREGINGNMAGNIVFQHQTEQVRTDTGKSFFVHGQFATDAPARVAGSVSVFFMGGISIFLCRSDSVVAVDANNTMLAAGQIGQYLAMCGFPRLFRREQLQDIGH